MPERRPLIDLDSNLSAGPAFWAGLASAPALVLSGSLPVKLVLLAGYLLLMAAAGRRVLVIPGLTAAFGITAANLLAPRGLVLAELFGLPVTLGALEVGLARSATIYCSRLTVRPGLRLPGSFGGLLGLSFYYFERIAARRTRFEWKRFWPALDELLEEAYRPGDDPPASAAAAPTPAGLAWALLFVSGHWTAFLIGLGLG
jgi:heptaprenyl diphosphate synthase